ncbi:MAG: alanine--tRNA ligase [Fibrobacterota bacterium]
MRETFIRFFTERGHTFVKSAPIFPKDDPSLLFTNAGMNQFKNIFLGVSNEQNLKRAANSQKCMRVSGKHNDLEEVGRDHHHHTFFEMLGNWSFGDYYKKEAIAWAWELLTKVWKLPKDKLFVTVHTQDEEAAKAWMELTDVKADRLMRFEENFWEMGDTGPCGSCSEIHIDRGEGHCVNEKKTGHTCGVNVSGCGRFVELWNLVFMQNNRAKDGTISELPAKNIDTGMGFERIVAVLQNKPSNYDTDAFYPIIARLEKMSGKKYSHSHEGTPFRVIADHLRALTVAITDGVLPSNEGRGYVMRRLLRRAYRYGKKLGFKGPFLNEVVPEVVFILGSAYPELAEREAFVRRIIETEEKSFEKTLDKGLSLFSELAEATRKAGNTKINGKGVFKLYDTYGFPADLTNQLAQENGLTIDEAGFTAEMQAQKERARAGARFKAMAGASVGWVEVSNGPSSLFTGYDALDREVALRKVRKTDKGYDFVTDQTPFYAESGGQAGDTGIFEFEDLATIEIVETRKEGADIVHVGACADDVDLSNAVKTVARVDADRRTATRRNHTATHIMQYALRKVLGDHAKQSGSSNGPDRFRFDFTHFAALKDDELEAVERLCNEVVLANHPVVTTETGIKEAEKTGAIALFGEKYGDRVRVVNIGNESIELCGGTHAACTGEIGYIHILMETSVSAGIRRVEAVTGRCFGELFRVQARAARGLSQTFKSPFERVPEQVAALFLKVRGLEKDLASEKQKAALSNIDELVKNAALLDGHPFIKEYLKGSDRTALQAKAEALAVKLGAGVAVLFSEGTDGNSIMVALSADLVKNGLNAGKILKILAEAAGGKGGGRPNFAQGGAKDAALLRSVFDRAETLAAGAFK